MSFEPNCGQSDPSVRFLAEGPGYGLFLTADRAVFSLESGTAAASRSVLSMRFLGARQPAIGGVHRLGGDVNYISAGRSRQEIGIPTYGGVRYAGVWPGIGMRFYGNGRRLEYDFDLAPGAGSSEIGLRFSGQRDLRLAPDGALVLRLGGRAVRQPPPHAFQALAGTRHLVASRYVLGKDGRVGIALGRYDHSRPLTIDPRLVYSTYLGRGILGAAAAIAVDSSGAAYVTGITPSSKFPTTTGTFPGQAKRRVAFVTKLSPSGRHIVYSTFLGGSGGSHAQAIAVDGEGHAFVAGHANSPDFPTTRGSFRPKQSGSEGAFVAKLSRRGRGLLYSAYIGRRDGPSTINDIAVNGAGDAFLVGATSSAHFPTTRGALQRADPNPKGYSGFVAKVSPAGSHLLYSTYLAGKSENDAAEAVAIDSSGNAYVTGYSNSGSFPITHGAFQTKPHSAYGEHSGAYVTKLNPTGSKLVYSTYLPGGLSEPGEAIAVDPGGRAYVVGTTRFAKFPTTPKAYETERQGAEDLFVTALSPDGSSLEASTFLGAGGPGGLAALGTGIGLTPRGDVVVSGYTNSMHFPVTKDALQPKSHSRYWDNSIIAELSPNLHSLLYSTYLAGGSVTHIRGLAIGPSGSVYVTGASNPGLRQTAHPLPRGHDHRFSSHPNAFVTKLGL